jgi:GGDEF domain-containing protein
VSCGVATFPLDAQDDIALIKAADARLYRAKEAGRNCTVGPEAAGT